MNATQASEYEPQYDLQLVRHAELREFTCSRCGAERVNDFETAAERI